MRKFFFGGFDRIQIARQKNKVFIWCANSRRRIICIRHPNATYSWRHLCYLMQAFAIIFFIASDSISMYCRCVRKIWSNNNCYYYFIGRLYLHKLFIAIRRHRINYSSKILFALWAMWTASAYYYLSCVRFFPVSFRFVCLKAMVNYSYNVKKIIFVCYSVYGVRGTVCACAQSRTAPHLCVSCIGPFNPI